MLALRWTEQAIGHLGAIAEYISLSSPIYADGMIERLVARLQLACEHPLSGRHVAEYADPAVRELIEPPYRLIYRVRADSIDVLAIVHSRQSISPQG